MTKKISNYSNLLRVTSDARPWPAGGYIVVCKKCKLYQTIPNQKWKMDCKKIYRSYQIYKQANGAEQTVFSKKNGVPRSQVLTSWITKKLKLPKSGKILDIGCGNGGFLREFQKRRPHWELFGSEFSNKNIKSLQKIPNFKKLYYSNYKPPNHFFDLVVCIHVLEHILNPSKFVNKICRYLKNKSPLLIQVPDASVNPFILLIADHASHFTTTSLEKVIRKTKLKFISKPQVVVKRELSCLVQNKRQSRVFRAIKTNENILANINKLAAFAKKAKLASKKNSITIFGSSIGAAWLFNVCKGRVKKFIDEDKFKINKTFFGKKIERLKTCKSIKDSEIWVPIQDKEIPKKLKQRRYGKVNTLS